VAPIRKCFRRLVLSLAATRNCSKVTRHVVSLRPSIVARSYHTNPPYLANCDWGRPCDCPECRESARSPICDICKVLPTEHLDSKLSHDRKGVRSYIVTSFCGPCLDERLGLQRKRDSEKEQKLAFRRRKLDEMMNHVRGIHSTEQVPIKYAVEKLLGDIRSGKGFSNSRQWYQQHLIQRLSRQLQIVKVRNRYMCNKQRVDAMDLKLWFLHRSTDIDV